MDDSSTTFSTVFNIVAAEYKLYRTFSHLMRAFGNEFNGHLVVGIQAANRTEKTKQATYISKATHIHGGEQRRYVLNKIFMHRRKSAHKLRDATQRVYLFSHGSTSKDTDGDHFI